MSQLLINKKDSNPFLNTSSDLKAPREQTLLDHLSETLKDSHNTSECPNLQAPDSPCPQEDVEMSEIERLIISLLQIPNPAQTQCRKEPASRTLTKRERIRILSQEIQKEKQLRKENEQMLLKIKRNLRKYSSEV